MSATINQDLKALVPKVELQPVFLAEALRTVKAYVLTLVSTAAHGTKRLDSEALRQIPVLLPPMALQREFARRANLIDRLKTAQRAHLAELDALFASLQHRAFRGEL